MKAVSKRLRQQFAVVRDLLAVLGYDTIFCLAKFEDELQQPGTTGSEIAQLNFWLKASVRTFFAQVEGVTYAMRRFVVAAAEEGHIQLEPKIVAQVQERKYNKATGELGHVVRGRFDDNFKNALRYFPRAFGCDWAPEFQGGGWEKFRKLVEARDDFTHPKCAEHLFKGAAGEDLHSAVTWFWSTFNALLRAVGQRLGKEVDIKSFPIPDLLHMDKLSLIKPPSASADPAILVRETQFMSLLAEEADAAYRVFMDGAAARNGALVIGETSQTGVRLFVRTLFTEIEAIGYMTHRLLDDSVSKEDISFSEDERELLGTKELVLKIAYSAEVFSRKFGYSRSIDKSGELWSAFSRIARYRDSITHPKESADLQIDIIEALSSVAHVLEWFQQLLDAIEISDNYLPPSIKALSEMYRIGVRSTQEA